MYMAPIDIKFVTDVNNGKTHEFSCSVPKAFKEKMETMYKKEAEGQNMLVVDKYINEFNEKAGGIVTDYEYDLIGSTDVNIGVVLKHLFRGMKEPRRYVKCKVRTADNKVMVKMTDKIQSKIAIPANTEKLPVSSIIGEYTENPNDIEKVDLSIRFETTCDMRESKSFDAAIAFITEGMYEAFDEADAPMPTVAPVGA